MQEGSSPLAGEPDDTGTILFTGKKGLITTERKNEKMAYNLDKQCQANHPHSI
jgi:hypothetical protein